MVIARTVEPGLPQPAWFRLVAGVLAAFVREQQQYIVPTAVKQDSLFLHMEGTQASTDIIFKLYDSCSMLKGIFFFFFLSLWPEREVTFTLIFANQSGRRIQKSVGSQTSNEKEPTIPRVLAVFPTQRFHQPPSAAPPPTPTIGTYKPFNSYLVSGHSKTVYDIFRRKCENSVR